MSLKLNVLLAKTEHGSSIFKKNIGDNLNFFKGSQGAFKGARKTYDPKPDTADEPSRRSFAKVTTTVPEKLKYFETEASEYINNVLAVEATNASGNAKAELIIEDTSLGMLSTGELMKIRSLLEMENLEGMYANIPVRSDAEVWEKSENEALGYKTRAIYEQEIMRGTAKSIEKEQYILEDPNVQHLRDTSKYVPQQGVKQKVIELGDWTAQLFSGESTQIEKAGFLSRRSKLLAAVKEAIKKANEAEVVNSEMTAVKLFNYLHRNVL